MKHRNFKLLIYSNSITYFAFQLLGPFLVLYINNLGGSIENLGLLFGVSLLMNSITQFIVGKYSDKIGRKPFLIASGLIGSIAIVFYLYVQTLPQLYILQIVTGANNAVWAISESIFLADITKKETRGKMMGIYNLILGIFMAVGMMLGGFAIGKFGFSVIFWFVGIASLLSTFFLFFIKEKKTKNH